jgi:hypothetical protein
MKKKKRRLNAVDVCLILLLLLSIVCAAWRTVTLSGHVGAAEEEATVTLFLRGVAPSVYACMQTGETLYTAEGTSFGVLAEKRASAARAVVEDGGRRYVGAWREAERVDVEVKIAVRGRLHDGVFFEGGRRAMRNGMRLCLYGALAELNGEVAEVASDFKNRINDGD